MRIELLDALPCIELGRRDGKGEGDDEGDGDGEGDEGRLRYLNEDEDIEINHAPCDIR
jgi:hypothetical protein